MQRAIHHPLLMRQRCRIGLEIKSLDRHGRRHRRGKWLAESSRTESPERFGLRLNPADLPTPAPLPAGRIFSCNGSQAGQKKFSLL
jgi:hypothetical protein